MPTIWCISGLHSPRWVSTIAENFVRQTYAHKRLVVVENGDGTGAWMNAVQGSHLVESEPGAVNYVNAGLAYVRKHARRGDLFVKFDADDYYGGNRLATVARAFEGGGNACGASAIFVRTESDRLWLVANPPGVIGAHGPTLGGHIDKAVDFRSREPWGEDANWLRDMLASGAQVVDVPLPGFAYCRHRGAAHTFPLREDELRHAWNAVVYDCGPWNSRLVDAPTRFASMAPVPFNAAKMAEAFARVLDERLNADRAW